MAQRISHSLLDPWLTIPLKVRYPSFRIPAWLPPEAIVVTGHLSAALGAFGLACSTSKWWGGIVAALGISGNHICDVLDGTHARTTGQCRNGGELLDHFMDPLSFAYILCGLAVSCGRLDLGLAAVICLFATAVLTNIKAKLTGEFTLDAFGPTEFKVLLVGWGLTMSALSWASLPGASPLRATSIAFPILVGYGVVQLVINLVRAVHEVNRRGKPADTSEWVTTRGGAASIQPSAFSDQQQDFDTQDSDRSDNKFAVQVQRKAHR